MLLLWSASGPPRDPRGIPGRLYVISPSVDCEGCAVGQGLVMVCFGVTPPLPAACWTSLFMIRPKQPVTA